MDIWKHGTYVDMWSIVHILSGALLAIGAYWLGLSFLVALLATTVLLVAWECYEWLLKILEVPTNVCMDIVLGLLGFLAAAYWHYGLGMPFDLTLALSLAAFTGAIAAWGFADFFFRGYR